MELIDIVMPDLGPTIDEGTVVEWVKGPGDLVAADEPVCLIATDKVDADVSAPAPCRIHEILVPAGETVVVGTVLARAVAESA